MGAAKLRIYDLKLVESRYYKASEILKARNEANYQIVMAQLKNCAPISFRMAQKYWRGLSILNNSIVCYPCSPNEFPPNQEMGDSWLSHIEMKHKNLKRLIKFYHVFIKALQQVYRAADNVLTVINGRSYFFCRDGKTPKLLEFDVDKIY